MTLLEKSFRYFNNFNINDEFTIKNNLIFTDLNSLDIINNSKNFNFSSISTFTIF